MSGVVIVVLSDEIISVIGRLALEMIEIEREMRVTLVYILMV